MSFLHELKRRRVVRVAIVYAATAFVVLQAADLLGSGPALPPWVFAAITVVTILGFPLALVLAWAFQITREDAARESAAAERWLSGRTIGVAAVTLLLVMGGELRVLDLESGSVRSLSPAPAPGGAAWQ